MPTFLDILQQKGLGPYLKRGSRYVGPCPFCGGSRDTNRFVTKADSETGKCFSCDWGGGTVKLLMQLEGVGCKEAHGRLGIPCDNPACPVYEGCHGTAPVKPDHAASVAVPVRREERFVPAAPRVPAELWQAAALKLVEESHQRLLENPGALAYLSGRGLGSAAVEKYRLGWLAGERGKSCIFRPRATWGLPELIDDRTKKPKKLWIPRGIVIPTFVGARVDRIRIRRLGEDLRPEDAKYIALEGGGSALVSLNPEARAQMPVESDLDALLIDHLAGDLVGAIPLTTCTVRPDSGIAKALEEAVIHLVALDCDPLVSDLKTRRVKSGGPVNALWWQKQYPRQYERLPVPVGKDPGEAWQQGVDLRQWVLDALPVSLQPRPDAGKNHTEVMSGMVGQTAPKKEEQKVNFDPVKMQQLISDTHSRVQSQCPKGAPEWLDQHRSDVIRHLDEISKAVDAAYAAEDEAALKQALEKYETWHRKAWRLYDERPPVIEVQEPLFEMQQPLAER